MSCTGCLSILNRQPNIEGDSQQALKKAQDIRNKQINKEIEQAKDDHRATHRLLLLGAGESGKSTVVKQMKILHVNGYSEVERRQKRLDIKKNVRDAIEAITNAMSDLAIEYQGEPEVISTHVEIIKQTCQQLEEIDKDVNQEIQESDFTDEFFNSTEFLWEDSGIQEAYKRSNEYQLIDCAK